MSFSTYYPPHLQHMLPQAAPPSSPVRLDTEQPLSSPPPPPVTIQLSDKGVISDIALDESLGSRRRRKKKSAAPTPPPEVAEDAFAGVVRVDPPAPQTMRAPDPPAVPRGDRVEAAPLRRERPAVKFRRSSSERAPRTRDENVAEEGPKDVEERSGKSGGVLRSLSLRKGGRRRRRKARDDAGVEEEVREVTDGEDLFGGSGRAAFSRVAFRSRR